MKYSELKCGDIFSYEVVFEMSSNIKTVEKVFGINKKRIKTEYGTIAKEFFETFINVKLIKGKPFWQVKDDMALQNRLESVLSKFEDLETDIPRLRISQSTDDVYVIYIKEQNRFATRGLTLSLETVESLLNDLSSNKQ